jgi:hypothetical protein
MKRNSLCRYKAMNPYAGNYKRTIESVTKGEENITKVVVGGAVALGAIGVVGNLIPKL